jgi:hypothetical protein
VARGAVLRWTSSNEETNITVVEHIANSNVEEHNVAGADGTTRPSNPPSTTMHGTSSSKKISVIRGWTREDIMKAIDDVEFNGTLLEQLQKNMELHQHQCIIC